MIQYSAIPRKIALIGNSLPRKCGIATFTTDLLTTLSSEVPDAECWSVVMNDVPEGYPYPSQVRFELDNKNLTDYHLAADFLNFNQVDVVCLQHEFGIFGGDNGAHILELLTKLRMPVITTLHTVLDDPSPKQMAVMHGIANISDRLVVMSKRAQNILRNFYGIPEEKIVMIHHGIPDIPFVDPNYYKDQFGVEGRRVILTFGLLSPGKGIEFMIDALPAVVQQHNDVVYIILGATHPNIKREHGESYRLSLQRRARQLGVDEHLIFHNRFVEINELCEFLGAADIYVTPYLNEKQIASGTLAYALGTGKATISNPYWYAEEMLDDRRGRIVPFEDSEALAYEVNDLLTNDVERHAMRKRAYTFCREMVWKEVTRKYLEVFIDAMKERENKPRAFFRPMAMKDVSSEMPHPELSHVIRLTDDVGILQHAKFIVPDRYHGYCTDDNARALVAVLMAQEIVSDDGTITKLACTYISFLHHAFDENTRRFRNFMRYDRRWMEEEGSPDSHGRAIWGLGKAVSLSHSDNIRGAALDIFEKSVPALLDFQSPRAWAFGLLGIHAYLRKYSGDSEVRRIRERLSDHIFKLYQENASGDWPWIEETLTYANGKISQALIMSGQFLNREDMLNAGLRSLEWLVDIQTDPKGHFVPIGNNGWYSRSGEKARFDQQPIEAQAIIEACFEAYNVTRETRWISFAQRSFDWFLGQNDMNVPLYDPTSGGCCDGIGTDGPNRNQGAESTLAWLLSLLNLFKLRSIQLSSETSGQIEVAKKEKRVINDS